MVEATREAIVVLVTDLGPFITPLSGLWVVVKQIEAIPNTTPATPAATSPTSSLQLKYPLRELPLQHRDQYRFVSEAIGCLRSLTPKFIVHDVSSSSSLSSSSAMASCASLGKMKCTLMENDPLPLFDVQYQDGGCVRISTAHGT
jgi:hypothetical protein